MVMGRLKGAVSDVAETLRRAFTDPPSHGTEFAFGAIGTRALDPVEARGQAADFLFRADPASAELGMEARPGAESVIFEAKMQSEEAFARWAAGARVCEMETFGAASGIRSEIPPLPRRAQVRPLPPEGFRARCRPTLEAFPRPRAFQLDPRLEAIRVRRGLEVALGLPMAVVGEDLQALPRPIWMRYTLQIVKATGENIRNLDVLGLYRIPAKGVEALRHDPRTGRLVIQLGAAAAGSRRTPFLLARRKDDRTIVSCYLEEV